MTMPWHFLRLVAKRKKCHGIVIAHVFDDVAAEDPAELPCRLAQVFDRVLLVDREAALPAGGHRLLGMIDAHRLNSGIPQQFQEDAAAAAYVQHRSGIAEKLHKALLHLAHNFFVTAELIKTDGFHCCWLAPWSQARCAATPQGRRTCFEP